MAPRSKKTMTINNAPDAPVSEAKNLSDYEGVWQAKKNLNHCFGVLLAGDAATPDRSDPKTAKDGKISSSKISSGYPTIPVGEVVLVKRNPDNPFRFLIRHENTMALLGSVDVKILLDDYQRIS